jgi:hypothetical protein
MGPSTRRTAFPKPSTLQALICTRPKLPKPRTDQRLMIEVLVSSGTDTNRKKDLVTALIEKLGEAGIDPTTY